MPDDGSELRYRAGVAYEQLAVNECVILRGGYVEGVWSLHWCFQRITDGKRERRIIPLNIGGDQADGVAPSGFKYPLWGCQRVGPDRWKIIPSIACSERRPDPNDASKHIDVEVWHQNTVLVEVPDSEPWIPDRPDFTCG